MDTYTFAPALSLDKRTFQIFLDGEVVFQFDYTTQDAWVHPLYADQYPAFMIMADHFFQPVIHNVN